MKIERGFTLIELMVTLTIVGILLTVAVPSFNKMMADNRQIAQINELLGSLMYARSEAITENKAIAVCASSTQTSCSSDWSQGWIVYVPGATTITPLRVHSALSGSNTLSSTTGASFTFNANGTSSASGTFTLCDSRSSAYARALYLSSTGIARASQTVGEDLQGNALSCP